MSILVNLPSILFSIIVTEWLNVEEWAKLDSACCNTILRHLFLVEVEAILPQKKLNFFTKFVHHLGGDLYEEHPPSLYYNWISLRKIKLENYVYDCSYLRKRSLNFNFDFKFVKSLTFLYAIGVKTIVTKIINSCPNLAEIDCEDCSLYLKIKEKVLANLKRIVVNFDILDVHSQVLAVIAKNCRKLEVFIDKNVSTSDTLLVIKNNPNLGYYVGCGNHEYLENIIDNYDNIKRIHYKSDTLSLVALTKAIVRNKITTIRLMYNNKTSEYVNENEKKILSVFLPKIFDMSELNVLVSHTKNLNAFKAVGVGTPMSNFGTPMSNEIVRSITCYSCRTLKNFQSSLRITKEKLEQILRLCINLETLGLFCTVEILEAFQLVPNSLKILLVGCMDLTVPAFKTLLKSCPVLNSIIIAGIQPSSEDVEEIKRVIVERNDQRRLLADFRFPGQNRNISNLSFDGNSFIQSH